MDRFTLAVVVLLVAVGGVVGAAEAAADGNQDEARARGRAARERTSGNANELALAFLARHQEADGAWNPATAGARCTLDGPRCEPLPADRDTVVATTARALLAFCGCGYDHRTPNRYRPVLRAGLMWLQAQQQADGRIGEGVAAQALATAALCEAYGMTSDPLLKDPAQRAVDRLLAQRLPGGDGLPQAWGAVDAGDSGLTLLATCALRAAKMVGLPTSDSLDRVASWWRQAWVLANPHWDPGTDPGRVPSTFPASWSLRDGVSGADLPAGALLATLLDLQNGPALSLLHSALDGPRSATASTSLRDLRWCMMNAFLIGGERWRTRQDALLSLAAQRTGGCLDGSWDAAAPGGRLAATAEMLMVLSMRYHYGPGASLPAAAAGR